MVRGQGREVVMVFNKGAHCQHTLGVEKHASLTYHGTLSRVPPLLSPQRSFAVWLLMWRTNEAHLPAPSWTAEYPLPLVSPGPV